MQQEMDPPSETQVTGKLDKLFTQLAVADDHQMLSHAARLGGGERVQERRIVLCRRKSAEGDHVRLWREIARSFISQTLERLQIDTVRDDFCAADLEIIR